jgi:hypothetical protein
MANGITDLGNDLGWIYVMEPDGVTFADSIRNTSVGVKTVKSIAAQANALSLNKRAYGIITVNTVTGSGDVTAINIDGVNQLGGNVSYAAGSAIVVASAIAAGINSFTPGSGDDYIATSILKNVYVYAPISAGDSPNGKAITVSNTGNLSTTQTAIDFGSNGDTVYDSEIGYRFFIDADYNSSTAAPGVLSGNQVEITNAIITRGLNMSFDRQSKTIAAGVISITRQSAITVVDVDTESSAASDDLDSISFGDGADGDIIILRGANASRVVTVTAAGNLNRVNAFATAAADTQIVLMYIAGEFHEASRSGGNYVPTAAAFRTALFPLLTSTAYGRATVAPADNTTTTVTPNSSKKIQRIAGTVSLTTGNYIVDIVTTNAIAGDEFFIAYYGQVTAVGPFTVVIESNTLSVREALLGGVIMHFVYDGSWLIVGKYYDLSVYTLEGSNIGSDEVAAGNLSDNLKYETMTIPVSFEATEVGDIKVLMPFPCAVTNTFSSVSKTIAATDDGTIAFKNNAGSTMAGATITIAATSAVGTTDTGLATTNNTFTAGQVMTLTTAKTTAGGRAVVTVQLTRS